MQDSTVASGTRRRGRQAKASKQAQQAESGAEGEAAEGAAALPESRWGEEPARLSSVGLEEDEAHFGTRLRYVCGETLSWVCAFGMSVWRQIVFMCPAEESSRSTHCLICSGCSHPLWPCRKTLRLYLACLSDAAMATEGGALQGEAGQPPPLDTLQAAAAYLASPPTATKAWEGSGKLAK